MTTYNIVWNEARTVGIICEDPQLTYELRKGAMNPLGIVSGAFMDAWGDMTADDNCTIQAEVVAVPLELLKEVLDTAADNSARVEGEFACGPDDRAAHAADRDKINDLRAIAGIPIEE